jgi:hypothetical protein
MFPSHGWIFCNPFGIAANDTKPKDLRDTRKRSEVFSVLTFYYSPIINLHLLLHRFRHLISHRVIQTLRLQITERIAWRFEVIGELLRETLVKSGKSYRPRIGVTNLRIACHCEGGFVLRPKQSRSSLV